MSYAADRALTICGLTSVATVSAERATGAGATVQATLTASAVSSLPPGSADPPVAAIATHAAGPRSNIGSTTSAVTTVATIARVPPNPSRTPLAADPVSTDDAICRGAPDSTVATNAAGTTASPIASVTTLTTANSTAHLRGSSHPTGLAITTRATRAADAAGTPVASCSGHRPAIAPSTTVATGAASLSGIAGSSGSAGICTHHPGRAVAAVAAETAVAQ